MAIEYSKKQYKDNDTLKLISFWSTDDNVLCENALTLRENLNSIKLDLSACQPKVDESLPTLNKTMSGAILELKESIPINLSQLNNDSGYATEEFVLQKLEDVGLDNIDLSNLVTHEQLEAFDYANKTYVDNLIATHEHNTMDEVEVSNMVDEVVKGQS